MFAMICTDNLRYKKTKYYDSEYVIKGTLHINEHAYAFSHYEGAFEVLGIRWLSNYTKGRYSKDTGLEFSIGADTEEGRLLQEHKDEAIECILQTVHAFDILPTAKAGGFLHQPPLHSNRSCCVLHDVRQALLPVCPTVRYVLV